MTDEELLARLQEIRHRRSIERPAAKARVERAEKKETRKRMSALDKLLEGLSEDERALLMQELEQGQGNGNQGNNDGGSSEV